MQELGSSGRLNFFWEPMAAGKGGAENMAATTLMRVIQECICSGFLRKKVKIHMGYLCQRQRDLLHRQGLSPPGLALVSHGTWDSTHSQPELSSVGKRGVGQSSALTPGPSPSRRGQDRREQGGPKPYPTLDSIRGAPVPQRGAQPGILKDSLCLEKEDPPVSCPEVEDIGSLAVVRCPCGK